MEKMRLLIEKGPGERYRGAIKTGEHTIYQSLFIYGCPSEALKNIRHRIRQYDIKPGCRMAVIFK